MKSLIIGLVLVFSLGFMGCDNPVGNDNEVRIVAEEFRGRFENDQYAISWFELTENTIISPHHVGNNPVSAWTVGNELWIISVSTGDPLRIGAFSENGNTFNSPGGWGSFTRVTN